MTHCVAALDPAIAMSEAPQTRVIKRYANRKLYDTRDSRYITLDRIAQLVRDGEEVKILDNGSKRDLTKVTLAQIIYEEEKSGQGVTRSITSLRSFIQEGRDKLLSTWWESPVGKLVGRAEELTAEIQRVADDRVRALLESAAERVRALQAEVSRLQARIEELEAKVRQVGDQGTRKPPSEEDVE